MASVKKADCGNAQKPPVEIDYYRAGGILPYVLAQILRANG